MSIATFIRLEKPFVMKQAYAQKAKVWLCTNSHIATYRKKKCVSRPWVAEEEVFGTKSSMQQKNKLQERFYIHVKSISNLKTSSGSTKLNSVNRSDTLRSSRNSLEVPLHMSLKKKKSVRMDDIVIKMDDSIVNNENGRYCLTYPKTTSSCPTISLPVSSTKTPEPNHRTMSLSFCPLTRGCYLL